jgi:DNA-binding LacI/PurR family transcriptional regulator
MASKDQSSISTKTVTIEDVARLAGTALSTASLALNGKARVAPETREAVMKAAQQLGYEGNYYAQRLKGRCNNLISLLSIDLDFGVGTFKLKSVQRLLAERGYDVPIHSYGSFGGGEVADQVSLLRMMRRQKPQAIVCDTEGLSLDAYRELERFQAEGGHAVCFGYPDELLHPACDEVLFDTCDNTYQAARHLVQLGHRNIGLYIPGARRNKEARVPGFYQALAEFGVEVRPEWLFLDSHKLYEEGGAWMAQRFIGLSQRPTAMCIVNDVAAAAFVNEVMRAGLKVPDDVSVVSHDDWPAARYCIVPLSTASHPLQAIADQTVQFLLERLDNSYTGPPRRAVIQGELIVRESTRAL